MTPAELSEPAWLTAARKDIGNPESLGPNDSPYIRRMLAKLNATWLKGQPWCGNFCAAIFQGLGIQYPKAYYRAKEWATWGTACGPVLGAVVVFERVGGGHVGFLVGTDGKPGGRLRVLGGNQKDSIRESWFERERVIAYRWPPGVAFVATSPPVVAANDASSTNEA